MNRTCSWWLMGLAAGLLELAALEGAWAQQDVVYPVGSVATVGCWRTWNYSSQLVTIDSLDDQGAARFDVRENVTVDRALQRLVGVDANTTVRIGIQTDDGSGKPSGTWLVSDVWDPPDGNSTVFFTFGNATLTNGNTYHLVTKPETLGSGESFSIYGSSGSNPTCPYDGGLDSMAQLRSYNGGAWTVLSNDPFFILGSSTQTNGIAGPGQPYAQWAASGVVLSGGTQPAYGQKFKIFQREIPPNSWVAVTQAVFNVTKNGAITNNLIVRFLNEQLQEEGRVRILTTEADGTDRAYAVDPSFRLHVERTYYVAPEFEGERPGYHANTNYNFRTYTLITGAPMEMGVPTWGGTNDCTRVQSASGGSWTSATPDDGRLDLYFKLIGTVEKTPVGTVFVIR